jgi:hypothetical protein
VFYSFYAPDDERKTPLETRGALTRIKNTV